MGWWGGFTPTYLTLKPQFRKRKIRLVPPPLKRAQFTNSIHSVLRIKKKVRATLYDVTYAKSNIRSQTALI